MSFLVSMLATDLIQDEDRTTWPYHRRRLEPRAAVTSCIPSLAQNKSMEISSWGLTQQIHLIINLSFRQSRCKSGEVWAHISLPWRRAERTQASNTFPRTVRDHMCLDVNINKNEPIQQLLQNLLRFYWNWKIWIYTTCTSEWLM